MSYIQFLINFFSQNKRIFIYCFIVFLIINNVCSFGMELEEKKEFSLKFMSIPNKWSVEWKSNEPSYLEPDFQWHKDKFYFTQHNYQVLEQECQWKDPYNVATFKIRAFWSDQTITEVDFSDILFLSKINLRHLINNVKYNNKIPKEIKEENIVDFLKKQSNKKLDNSVKELKCLGDFFPEITIGETPAHLARKAIADLFDFKEKYETDEHSLSERYTRIFKTQLKDQSQYFSDNLIGALGNYPNCTGFCNFCFKNKNNQRCANECTTCDNFRKNMKSKIDYKWKNIADDIGIIYENSLYGLLQFDDESDKTARKYFKGETATNAFLKFDQNFADSEQAIYQFLLSQSLKNNKRMENLKSKSPNVLLKNVTIDIMSYRPMCKFCEGTALRYIENKQILNAILKILGIKTENVSLSFFVSYVEEKYNDASQMQ